MKKTIRTLLLTLIVAVMVFALAACGGPTMEEVVGVYEMTSADITAVRGDTTIELSKDFYKEFRMTFKEDGNATVYAKYPDGSTYSANGTFTCGGGKVRVTTTENGVKATETYSWSNGVITYKFSGMQDGMTIRGTIELTKKA